VLIRSAASRITAKQGTLESNFPDETGSARETLGRTVTETDIVLHAGQSGDFYPHHLDAEWCKPQGFTQRLAHGTLIFTIAVGLTAGDVNPEAFTYGDDRLHFIRPVFIADTLRTRVTLKEKRDSPKRPDCGIVVELVGAVNQWQETVVACEHLLMVKRKCVMERENLTRGEIAELLCRKGGLLAISGVSNDLRDLEEAAARGHHRARLAVRVFVYQVKKFVGAYAAAMDGLNALAFAGGIGENSHMVRHEVCRGLEFLGIYLDEEKNRAPLTSDRIISEPESAVPVFVIRTNEEIIVARETTCTLTSAGRLASGDFASRL